jgi:TPR repeat protein
MKPWSSLRGRIQRRAFKKFERAAAKGNADASWILSVVGGMEMTEEETSLKTAFGKTEEPLGWYFAGLLSPLETREEFEFFKKSAEGGCSWGQVKYAWYFLEGFKGFSEQNESLYVKWLQKAAKQNNPDAMHWLACHYTGKDGYEEQVWSYFQTAAELGWRKSMGFLVVIEPYGKIKGWRNVYWAARRDSTRFWTFLEAAGKMREYNKVNQHCYVLGWGLYWYKYGTDEWNQQGDDTQRFGNLCIDFYCSTVKLQQESIFTFQMFWKQKTGVTAVGILIAKYVWEEDMHVRLNRLWK